MVGSPRTERPAGARRALWLGMGVVAATLGIVAWLVASMLDPEALKPRLVAEVRQATGRTLTISGPIGLKLALTPTLTLDDVALSNPPGFSRPEMVRIGRVEVRLALSPLLERRVEIVQVTLARPDVLLETDAAGRGNWVFAREAPPVAAEPPTQGPAKGPRREPFAVSLDDVRVEDGRIAWRVRGLGRVFAADVPVLTLTAAQGAPTHANGTVVVEGRKVTVEAQGGALERLGAAGVPSDWPLTLNLESDGATVKVERRIGQALQGSGNAFVADGTVPDPGVFAPFLPRLPLSAMKAVTLHAELTDNGTRPPTVQLLRLGIGTFDATPVAAGAVLRDVVLEGRGGEPLRLTARLVTPRAEVGIDGTAGTLPWLMNGARGPVAVDLTARGDAASGSARGEVRDPQRLTGFALDVAGTVADPARLFDRAPPALKAVSFQFRLTDAPGLTPFRLDSSAGRLEGEIAIVSAPRVAVTGQIRSRRFDFDVLRPPPPAPADGGQPAGNQPVGGQSIGEPAADAPPAGQPTGAPDASVPPKGAPSSAPRPAAAPKPTGGTPARSRLEPILSGAALHLERLRAQDADVTVRLESARLNGAELPRIDATVALRDGALLVEPFTLTGPNQSMSARLAIDAARTPASVHLTVRAPSVALGPLLSLLDLPPLANGTAEIRGDLTAAGDTPRTLAASLNGWAGVAVQGGRLDARLINEMLEAVRPLRLEGGEATDLRCLAARAEVRDGVVTLQPLALNTPALILEGSGDVDLGHETLKLLLRPRTRIGGTGLALPLRVSGPWRAPVVVPDISPNGGGGGFAGLILGGRDIMGAAGGGDPCPAALIRARASEAAAEPSAPAAVPTAGPPPAMPVPPAALDALRRLLSPPSPPPREDRK